MLTFEVKKTDEAITFQKTTITQYFEVNGKQVQVYCYSSTEDDDLLENEPYEIEQGDLAHLTEEEQQIFGENLDEWLALKVGESHKGDAYKLK